MSTRKEGSFLHIKLCAGRPPPEARHLSFAHELEAGDPAAAPDGTLDLPDSLKTDVQRKGVLRWLEQNFKEGSYIWEVVRAREREVEEGMYALLTRNWARSVGDPKLHLSLYIYQEDRHVATW
ncbi:hypothetical protein JCM8202v2_004614, partial [Rhodotorula sphaerocarpa]